MKRFDLTYPFWIASARGLAASAFIQLIVQHNADYVVHGPEGKSLRNLGGIKKGFY